MATSNHSEPKPSKQTANRALRVVRIIHQLDKLAIPIEFLRALTTVVCSGFKEEDMARVKHKSSGH